MAYCTLDEVKAYLKLSGTAADALLAQLIAAAQAKIEADRRRAFEAVAATRYYTEGDLDGDTLYLWADLLTVTKLTNGDAAATEIPSDGYVLLPRNSSPKAMIRLKSPYTWVVDPDREIGVAGTWGYSAVAPEDIALACLRLAAYYYRNRDSQVFDVVATPELGTITVPKGIPADVREILNGYPKRRGWR